MARDWLGQFICFHSCWRKNSLFGASQHSHSVITYDVDQYILVPDHLCLNNNAQNLIFINRDNTEHNDSLVTGQKASPAAPVVPGINVSPGKGDPKVTNGQNRETNIDINKPTDQSPQQQQLLSSAKPVNPPASDQLSIASLNATAEPQQQGAYSEPSNASVSQNTNVSSGSIQSEPPHTSSNVPVGMLIVNWQYDCSFSNFNMYL